MEHQILSNGILTTTAAIERTKSATLTGKSSHDSPTTDTETASPVGNKTLTAEEIADAWVEFCRSSTE